MQGGGCPDVLGVGLLLVVGGLLGQLALRIRLPAITGYVVAGLALGALPGGPMETGPLVRALQLLAGGYVLFVVGTLLSWSQLRPHASALVWTAVLVLLGMVGAVGVGVSLLPSGLLTSPDGLSQSSLLLLALVAGSPTVLVASCERHLGTAWLRLGVAAVVLLDAIVVLLAIGASAGHELAIPSVAELAACIMVGAIAAVVVVMRHRSGVSVLLGACFLLGVLVLSRGAWVTPAVYGLALLAGVGCTNAAPDAKATPKPERLHLALGLLFGSTAATIDPVSLSAFLLPAAGLIAARTMGCWIGSRLAQRLVGQATPPALGATPFVPQGGLALILVTAVEDPAGSWTSLILVMALLQLVAAPPLLAREARVNR